MFRHNPADDIDIQIGDCLDDLDAAGYVIGDKIDFGSQGMVFQSEPGKVIKITVTEKEACLANYLAQHPHPYFPEIYQVHEITHLCHSQDRLWAILRENLPNAPMSRLRSLFITLYYAADFGMAEEQVKDKIKILTSKENLERFQITKADSKNIKDFIKFVLWGFKRDILIGDLHEPSNWGRRDGIDIVRDFGSCGFKDWKKYQPDRLT